MERARKRYNLRAKFSKVYAKRSFKRKMPFTDLAATSKLRCEYVIYVRCNSGTQTVLTANSVSYNSITTEIQNNFSWTQYSADFLKYKIYGISVLASPVADGTSITDGASNIPINVVFYPNYVNASIVANEVMNNDSALRVEPNLTTKQYKYWHFPDNSYENSGYGFGIWSPTSGIANQVGQFSIGCNVPFANFGVGKTLYILRVCIYMNMGFKRY